jgi:hypothetical protein
MFDIRICQIGYYHATYIFGPKNASTYGTIDAVKAPTPSINPTGTVALSGLPVIDWVARVVVLILQIYLFNI